MQERPSIRANAISFNQKRGIGTITIRGRLALDPDVDDPVIEIWNAVQNKMETAAKEQKGVKLIHFTPLFPRYNTEADTTVYELIPTRDSGTDLTEFVAEAKIIIDIFYKKIFIACFHAFLEDRNNICNYNGYSLYQECIKKIEDKSLDAAKREDYIATTKMLLANFINFLGLPLPQSKKKFVTESIRFTDKEFEEAYADIPV